MYIDGDIIKKKRVLETANHFLVNVVFINQSVSHRESFSAQFSSLSNNTFTNCVVTVIV